MNSKNTLSKTGGLMLATLLFTLGIVLNGCATDDRYGTAGASPSPTATMSNTDLENAIKAKFDSDAQLKAAGLDVDADVSANSVTLSGTVDTQALRTRAVDMAKSAHAGLLITDKIEVKPREVSRAEWTEEQAREEQQRARDTGDSIGSSLDDTWIHTKIVAKLIGTATTPERKINVDVNNNVVTLRGNVDSMEAKTEAERVAKETEGVRRVINQIKVGAAAAATPTARK